MKEFEPESLFDRTQTDHWRIFYGCTHAWEALKVLKDYLREIVRPELKNKCIGAAFIGSEVFIDEGSVVEDGACILGPAYIGKNVKIRHGAYIRENVIVGNGCVVGNCSELKNCILFNDVQVPHFNYVGDSILGYKAHIGAGVILSNLRSFEGTVKVKFEGGEIDTGLTKFGALIGDGAEIGCNAVLNPGSVIGRGAVVYPCVSWRGFLPPGKVAKLRQKITIEDVHGMA